MKTDIQALEYMQKSLPDDKAVHSSAEFAWITYIAKAVPLIIELLLDIRRNTTR